MEIYIGIEEIYIGIYKRDHNRVYFLMKVNRHERTPYYTWKTLDGFNTYGESACSIVEALESKHYKIHKAFYPDVLIDNLKKEYWWQSNYEFVEVDNV